MRPTPRGRARGRSSRNGALARSSERSFVPSAATARYSIRSPAATCACKAWCARSTGNAARSTCAASASVRSSAIARGAYSYVTVGGEGARQALQAPLADTLYFAGEATDTQGEAGTVAGGLQSGLRAARQLI